MNLFRVTLQFLRNLASNKFDNLAAMSSTVFHPPNLHSLSEDTIGIVLQRDRTRDHPIISLNPVSDWSRNNHSVDKNIDSIPSGSTQLAKHIPPETKSSINEFVVAVRPEFPVRNHNANILSKRIPRKIYRCSVPGCMKQVQTRRLCKAHGGGVRCSGPGCTKLAQSRGRCVQHGGGRRCAFVGCTKVAQFKGLCHSHGGGRRCIVPECQKFIQFQGHCKAHLKQLEAKNATKSQTTITASCQQHALTNTDSKLDIGFVPTSNLESPRTIAFSNSMDAFTLEYSTDFDGLYFSIP